jgi:putative oxidoreductase
MRLVCGISLIADELVTQSTGSHYVVVLTHYASVIPALLLIAGLWTPIAAALALIVGVWHAFSGQQDLWACALIASLGAALALLGPGAWSIDARLFGWKQIEIRTRKS